MSAAMELSWIDIVYFVFIGLVIIGGIAAIIILCPKENKLREEKKDCYRFIQKDGRLMQSTLKPSLFEKRNGSVIYIEKGPFEIEAFFDNIKGKDEKSYRAGAILQLYLPESGAETAAEYLYSVLNEFSQDTISAMLRVELEAVLASVMKNYSSDTDMNSFTKEFRETAVEKLGRFGYDLYCPPTLKIAENN